MITSKQGREIAILINTCILSRKKYEEHEKVQDMINAWLWLDSEYVAATKLVNMGIPYIAYAELEKLLESTKRCIKKG